MVVAFKEFGSITKFRNTVSPETCGANGEGELWGTCLCYLLGKNGALNNEIGRDIESKAPSSGVGFRQVWQLFSTCCRRDSPISTR